MRASIKIFASIILALTLNLIAHAKEWRGIVPLHSTRSDVERILGQPWRNMHNVISIYALNEGSVEIHYASEGFINAKHCAETVPPSIVLVIYFYPKPGNDLHPDVKGFKEFDPGECMGLKAYYGEKDGVVFVKTYKGQVFLICYMTTSEDKHFCPSYYNPQTLVHFHPDY